MKRVELTTLLYHELPTTVPTQTSDCLIVDMIIMPRRPILPLQHFDINSQSNNSCHNIENFNSSERVLFDKLEVMEMNPLSIIFQKIKLKMNLYDV